MVRTKKYECGDYLEIEAFNLAPDRKILTRAKKAKESSPAQKKLNNKKSARYFRRLCHLNFFKGDMAVTLNCDDEHLPEGRKSLFRMTKNYIDRLRRLWVKQTGRPKSEFKCVYVISNHKGDGSGSKARPHVHMIMTGGMDRDAVEEKWGNGFVNTKRLQFDEEGISGLSKYMAAQAKGEKGERSWSGTKNLIKPEPVISDRAMTKRQMEKIAQDSDNGEFIRKQIEYILQDDQTADRVEKLINKGRKQKWIFTSCTVEYDGRQLFGSDVDTGEGMGYSLLIRMRREYPRY